MGGRWPVAVLALGAIAMLAASACSDDTFRTTATGPAGPIPMSEGDVASAGAAIADGFTVPEGAVMVGGPIPVGIAYHFAGTPVLDRGWDVDLVVTGDPRPVFGAVLEQAGRAGFAPTPRDAASGAPSDDDSFCQELVSTIYRCGAIAFAVDPASRRYMTVEFTRRPGTGAVPPESRLHVAFSDTDRPLVLRDPARPGRAEADLGRPAPRVADNWPELPTTGERFGDGYLQVPPLRLVRGSRLIAPPFWLDRAAEPLLYGATLAVDANDLDGVVAGYDDQMARGVGYRGDALVDAIDQQSRERHPGPNGSTVERHYYSAPGGNQFSMAIVRRPGAPALLSFGTAYD